MYKPRKQIPDLFLTFGRIGALTFGGGYAMISLLDYECVEKKKWLTSDELMDVTVIAESIGNSFSCSISAKYEDAAQDGRDDG